MQDPIRPAVFKIIHLSSPNLVTEQSSSVLCGLLRALTDDYASDGASLLDVSGLLCKHALTPLKQSNMALDVLSIGDLGTATVGFSHSHKASYLHQRKEAGIIAKEWNLF